ncbi:MULTISPECIES: XRE family transcriptional regulator [Myroides]|uniref:Helix-turn-helix domain-containing protein n=1 Tax=Myroides albus TaxID=2562892 RepID=A0A6I3LCQ1_9FLAO|nr:MULTISPECIES: LexA family transcriptional regulator [Myroides]MTG97229.1 helix-turn-helix domain-containing protein [Myroides albus]MVX35226.1 helix-turn-helix domain-containing protein [Myroides sp. LoEW2-1]UVD78970.1 LexA family transcriptional regulator [Myroides albus]
MSFLADNIRYLRAQKSMSQQKVADELVITRARYSKYEEGASEPPLEVLLRISRFFHVSVDLMISVDLRKVPMQDLLKLEDNRILLPIMVDSTTGNNYIEIIPHKARAGYLTGYADPEFIQNLEQISLPFLREGKYRAFPIEGDSMPPHQEGSFIIGSYIERLSDVRDGRTYIVITANEGVVYKRVYRIDEETFELHSDNTFYEPYTVKAYDIIEIWEYACSIATQEFKPEDLEEPDTKAMFKEIRYMLHNIASHVKR